MGNPRGPEESQFQSIVAEPLELSELELGLFIVYLGVIVQMPPLTESWR